MKTNRGIKRILKYAGKYKASIVFLVFFSLAIVVGKVGGIMSFGEFFSQTFIGKNFEYVNWRVILMLVGFGLLWALSHYLAFVSSNTLAVRVMHDIRKDIYTKLIDLPLAYYKRNQSGEILSRILNDISIIEIFLMNIIVELIAQPLTVIVIIGIMIGINPRIAGYFFSIAPLLGLALGLLGGWVQNLSQHVQKNISNITSHIQETVYGIEVIKGFGVEQEIKNKFNQANQEYLEANRRELKVRLLGTPVSEFLGVVGVIIILILGAIGVRSGMAESKDIIFFISLALVLSEPLSHSSNIFMTMKKLTPASQRVFEIIDSEENEDFSLPEIGAITGKLEYRNVGFCYDPERIILSDINLTIKAGETVAIVGPSGAGKSTLISLIPAFYYPTKGQTLIDDKNTKEFNPLSIRKQLSLVTQETILFSGTIAENIRLSRPEADMDAVIEAAKIAHIHDHIAGLPDGYNSMIGEKGAKLSGGQRQRIVLARAIIRQPKILILDEATSSLDAESERMISLAMNSILGKQTTIIVTHKLSTIAHADKIVVVEQGKIVEIGTHEELVHNRGIYDRLYKIQINV